MNQKVCDTCKKDVLNMDTRSGVDYIEIDAELICEDCAQVYADDNPAEWKAYEITWEKASIFEKAYLVLKADLTGDVVVFTDMGTSPKWKDIDILYQYKIQSMMDKVGFPIIWGDDLEK